MLWLYILLGIFLAIFLILLIPVGVDAKYDKDFFLKATVGFVKITLIPAKPKKPKKKKKKKDTKPKSDKPKSDKPKAKKPNLIQKNGLSWLIDILKKAAELAVGALKFFFSHITVKKFMFSLSVAGKDAADTALKYGKLCGLIYPPISLILKAVRFRKVGIDITPNFSENAKTKLYFELKARVRFLWLVILVFKYGIKGLKLMLEINNSK